MRLRCAVLDDYQRVALTSADWSSVAGELDVTVIDRHIAAEVELAERIGDCEIVVIMRERTPFGASLFARLPKLRLLVTTGMRNASVDLAAARAHGVVVCGTAGSYESTVELTWALLLALARNIVRENGELRAGGPWQSTLGRNLHGAQLGLLGLGSIGGRVARVATAFGMHVSAWSENLTPERTDALGVTLAGSKRELLERSDVVSIHLVLSERTRGLLGRADLRSMKPAALLINTSRADIVVRDALVEALTAGWIAGAALDVFHTEPLPADDVLRTLPNVLATPHLGYVTRGNYAVFYRDVVEDIRAYLDGTPVRTLA